MRHANIIYPLSEKPSVTAVTAEQDDKESEETKPG